MKTQYIIMIVLVLFLFSVINQFVTTKDKAVEIYTEYESKVKNIENIHNNAWQTVRDLAKLEDKAREDFISYLNAAAADTASSNAASFVFINRNLQQRDPSLISNVMRVVENTRDEIKVANEEANYVASQYNAFVRKTWNAVFLIFSKYRHEVEIKQITSSRSQQALENGKDDESFID